MPGPLTNSSTQDVDVVIVGGGLVGASLACALRDLDLSVAVVEAVAPRAPDHPSYDERVIALSWTSAQVFAGIGLWAAIAPDAEPIRRVHVTQRGGFGRTCIDHCDEGVAALGHVVPARAIGAALQGFLAASEANAPRLVAPARVVDLRVTQDWVEIEVDTARVVTDRFRTRLLVAADGGDSVVRQRLAIPQRERPYDQDAIIATVTPDRPHQGVAYERFTSTGPLALLPMTEGRCSVVWSATSAETDALLALDDAAFLARLQDRFGWRLGRLRHLSRRVAFPLSLRLADESAAPRVVLIGNAAHTLHPVTGQGFNLGLRDVAALAEELAVARRAGGDPGGPAVLQAYQAWRRRDQATVAATTDLLARLFLDQAPPLRLARDLGLLGVELAPSGPRHLLARLFMGRMGRQTRLARGLPLEGHHD